MGRGGWLIPRGLLILTWHYMICIIIFYHPPISTRKLEPQKWQYPIGKRNLPDPIFWVPCSFRGCTTIISKIVLNCGIMSIEPKADSPEALDWLPSGWFRSCGWRWMEEAIWDSAIMFLLMLGGSKYVSSTTGRQTWEKPRGIKQQNCCHAGSWCQKFCWFHLCLWWWSQLTWLWINTY